MTGRIFLKLVAGVFCLLLLTLVTAGYFAGEAAKDAYLENLTAQLAEKDRMLAVAFGSVARADGETVKSMARAAGGRITVFASDGRVLADSDAGAAAMEDHGARPELREAFQGHVGNSVHRSAAAGVPFLYVAVPVEGGALRLAVPLSGMNDRVNGIRRRVLASTAAAFLPALALAAVLARFLSRRLAVVMAHAGEMARGNFRARLPYTGDSEFGRLARTLNEAAGNLQNMVEQLQREHAELEKLERVRKDFVINVSHELRTPLASIQGYTETLIDGALADADHNMRFLGIIRHNAERLARLTADLLTISRIEQKEHKFEFARHRVNDLVSDAVQLVRPIAEKRSIELVEEPGPDGAQAWCDDEAVAQILSNLLDNAIKYTPESGRITVGVRAADRFWEVFVRDTGIGIPAEDLPRLFERFYRVDKARSRELGGTGLGLSIVKHLVMANSGTARVESRLGVGSTFFFTLPAEEAVPAGGDARLNPEFTAT